MASPLRARALKQTHKVEMMNLAAERFRSPGLRAEEDKARQRMFDGVERDLALPESEVAILKKHGFMQTATSMYLPAIVNVPIEGGDRELERPDGVIIKRSGTGKSVAIRAPRDDEFELPGTFTSIHKARDFRAERIETWSSTLVTIPKMLFPSFSNASLAITGGSVDQIEFSGKVGACVLSLKTKRAIVDYIVAADRRICAERKLIHTAIQMIGACKTYGQALDFWPEIVELEVTLFGPPQPPQALIALSDEDKALFCANLSERGVQSNLCAMGQAA